MNDPHESNGNGNGGGFWRRLIGVLRGRGGDDSLRDSIEELLEAHGGDAGSPEESAERALLRNVLEMEELRVGKIRVPRPHLSGVTQEIPFHHLGGPPFAA